MENNYLNSLLSTLSAVQARQISELLQGLQAAGTIRNKEEYQDKLTRLSSLLNDTSPKPSFVPVRAITWDLCSSTGHNIMTTSIKNDIEAAFIQINELGEKLDDHHILFIKNLFADLEKGLQKQEIIIKKLELLSDWNNDYTHAIVNNFSSDGKTTISKENIFFDNRTNNILTEEEISFAVISESNNLILDSESDPRIIPVSVKLQTDSYSYVTERKVDTDTNINNIIDNTTNTLWTYSTYLTDTVSEVHVVLDFSLGSGKDVNYIVIEPGSSSPLYITNIDALAINGDRINLLDDETIIEGKTRIDFTRTNAINLLVTVATKTPKRAEYFIENRIDAEDAEDSLQRANAIAPIARQVVSSNNVISICNIPESSYSQINHNLYSIVIDNIWFGNSLYKFNGLFLSEPMKIQDIGLLAVKAREESETGTVQNSIEYDIIKIDNTPKYKETRFPIPKLNQTTVTSERLIPTKRSVDSIINNISRLRFLPSITGITVYKNGIALSIGSGWQYAIEQVSSDVSSAVLDWNSNLSLVDYSEYNVAPLGFYIKIFNIDSRAVYTIDYTIYTSDTLDNNSYNTVWLDKDKTIFLREKGEIFFNKDTDNYINSDIYLQITMRKNKSSRAFSPKLYEYALLASKHNE